MDFKKLFISIEQVTVCIEDRRSQRAGECLTWIKEDFCHFDQSKHEFKNDIQIYLEDDFPIPIRPFVFRTKMAHVYGFGLKRLCLYDKKKSTVLLQYQYKNKRTAQIKSSNEELLYEIIHTYILSALGELLESKGFVRLHAAGLHYNGNGYAFLLNQGGGKSFLALKASKSKEIKLLSDEILLFKNHRLYSFPIRMAFHKNELLKDFPEFSNNRIFYRKIFTAKILISIEKEKLSHDTPLSAIWTSPQFPHKLLTIWNIFWGIGLPQMTEFILTLPKLPILMKIATHRAKFCFKVFFGKIRILKLPSNYKDLDSDAIVSLLQLNK